MICRWIFVNLAVPGILLAAVASAALNARRARAPKPEPEPASGASGGQSVHYGAAGCAGLGLLLFGLIGLSGYLDHLP